MGKCELSKRNFPDRVVTGEQDRRRRNPGGRNGPRRPEAISVERVSVESLAVRGNCQIATIAAANRGKRHASESGLLAGELVWWLRAKLSGLG